MLSIQTNVNSLVAQQNLSVNSMFQSKTIAQLTSGYRINSSGDDAAGLAVANRFRNTVAELTQGVANGNDGVAQLQIMDGGMNNISMMLDRLKTLAMQSASASFTGDRATLNKEFQTDIAEIDRQSQSIGLNTGGTFNKNLAVYLGAGSGSQSQANSVVNVDLSKSAVDSQALGLTGFQAVSLGTGVSGANYDLSDASKTSVAAILADSATNTTSTGGTANFTFNGPGFGGSSGVTISVNLNGVNDTNSLVTNINAAIQSAASTSTSGKYADFKAANITASIHTDSTGKQQLAFNSSKSAFQVTAQDKMANALVGNLATPGTNADANAVTTSGTSLVAGGAYELGSKGATNTETDVAFTAALSGTQSVTISANDSNGVAHALTVAFDSASAGTNKGDTVSSTLDTINSALQGSNDATLKQITAVNTVAPGQSSTVGAINFVSALSGFSVAISAASTSGGLATTSVDAAIQVGAGGTADISTIAGAQSAVTAISGAVTALGSAQAAIGKSQNQLSYGISLAQSQITNFSSAEAQIRDANVAQQAANLTKAQVLQQASIAAMAQANSAPQAILKLLG